jgi:hypothetical protein
LRYSLSTGYTGIAKEKARFLAGQVQLLFRILRKGGAFLRRLRSAIESEDVIKKILKHLGLWDLKARPPPEGKKMTRL